MTGPLSPTPALLLLFLFLCSLSSCSALRLALRVGANLSCNCCLATSPRWRVLLPIGWLAGRPLDSSWLAQTGARVRSGARETTERRLSGGDGGLRVGAAERERERETAEKAF